MAKKTLADLHGPALSRFQGMFRCQQELMKITPVNWKNETSLFGRSRGPALEAVDRELKLYHDYGVAHGLTTVDSIENLAVRAVAMYYALKTWKADRSDKNPSRIGPDGWKYSTRNTSGAFERLDDVLTRSMAVTSEYITASVPASDNEWFNHQQRVYAERFCDLFKGARMIAKGSFMREQAATVTAAATAFIGDQTGLTGVVQGGLSSAGQAVTGAVRSGVVASSSAVVSGARSAVSSDAAQFMRQLAALVVQKFGVGDAVASAMREAIRGLGIAESFLQNCLQTAALAVGKAVAEILPGIQILAKAGEAASAFYKALKAHMALRKGQRNKFIIRDGAAGDAYDTIIGFWEKERNENLQEGGKALVKAVISGVCSAVTVGVGAVASAVISAAEKAYTAVKAVWDALMKVLDMVEEVTSVNAELAKLDTSANKNAKGLFEISPLLATYYFLCMESQEVVMLDCKMITMSGFTDVFLRLKKQVEPVADKAAEYLGEHGFMFVRANGKPFPIRAKLNDPSLKEQIKEAVKGSISDALEDARDEALGLG